MGQLKRNHRGCRDFYPYIKQRREERRLLAISMLGGKCIECGSTEKLECDHINPETKLFNIAAKLLCDQDKFMQEVLKCQLLCKPCHVERSARALMNKKNTKICESCKGTGRAPKS
jgi:hypothetical protein